MFDNEELALLNEYEAGEWTDAAKAQEEIALAKKAAKAYLDKTRAISIRLSQRDSCAKASLTSLIVSHLPRSRNSPARDRSISLCQPGEPVSWFDVPT